MNLKNIKIFCKIFGIKASKSILFPFKIYNQKKLANKETKILFHIFHNYQQDDQSKKHEMIEFITKNNIFAFTSYFYFLLLKNYIFIYNLI